jgi:hypothetical protein
LQAANLSDRVNRRAPEFADAFRNFVRHGKDLIRMFIQEEMVIAKVWAGHMPVKVLRLKIKREYIGKESVESPRNIHDGLWVDVGWSRERGLLAGSELSLACHKLSFQEVAACRMINSFGIAEATNGGRTAHSADTG